MKQTDKPEAKQEFATLCGIIRKLVEQNEYQKGEPLIKEAMGRYPHAPEPHNLMGLLFEQQGDHITAMKHFRAAWALDPTYLPARQNLECFGSFYSSGKGEYGESDYTDENRIV